MNWQIKMHEIMALKLGVCTVITEGRKVPQRALYGYTDIYTVDVAYFAHCGILFLK